jgi:hypothetical protein
MLIYVKAYFYHCAFFCLLHKCQYFLMQGCGMHSVGNYIHIAITVHILAKDKTELEVQNTI